MSEPFKVGEIGITQNMPAEPFAGTAALPNGTEVEVISALGLQRILVGWKAYQFHGYVIRTAEGQTHGVHASQLRRKELPGDDQKSISWDECPWQTEALKITH